MPCGLTLEHSTLPLIHPDFPRHLRAKQQSLNDRCAGPSDTAFFHRPDFGQGERLLPLRGLCGK